MNNLSKYLKAAVWEFVLAIGLITPASLFAQSASLTIDSCYKLAVNNYPLVKQMELIEKTRDYTMENASKGNLPQLSINGQGTYQSEVTSLSTPIFHSPEISKDQYKIYGEIYQSLTDVATIKQQKSLAMANAETEKQKVEVELYKLKERINQLYFGILLIDAQLEQTNLVKKDIQTGIDKTNAAIANGTALKSNADNLKAELLRADQRTIELKASRKGYIDMLAIFIKIPINESLKFNKPVAQLMTPQINRPELKMFDLQQKSINIQNNLITTKNLPKAGLFFQGGYGRPALNQLSNDFSPYYIGGVKLNWNFGGLYTAKNDRRLLKINKQSINVQKDIFIFNTDLVLIQQNSEVNKYQQLIESDMEIIGLREKVKQTAKSQLENGTISTNDYLIYVNAEDQARQNLILHQVQLGLAQYSYQTTSGNQ